MRHALLVLLGLAGTFASPLAASDPAVRVAVKGPKGEPVADAVVMLVPLGGPPPPAPAAPARIEIAQEDEQYQPHLTIVRTGSPVEFPNKDRIQHHLYSASAAKKFEKPLYAPGARETVVFDQPGIVTLGCNIHDWMVAYVVVTDTPWYGRTDANGQVEIRVPSGRYRLEAWHPRLVDERRRQQTAPVTRELTVDDTGATAELALTLAPERRIRRAPVGKAGRY